MTNEVNPLSVIEQTDMTTFKTTMGKIEQFQKLVRENLREGKDYGTIPGTSKPTLYKPGAEKILMLMGLQSTYDIIDTTRDWEKGFFQYQVKCTLQKGGLIITQGLGACNSKENKYARQNPYNIDNTILKMAKKRSQVDASLTVASLSEIFTQDLEDIGIGNDDHNSSGSSYKSQKTYKPTDDPASDKQIALIEKNILESHLIKEPEYFKIKDYLEKGMSKSKASDIIGWWLGDSKNNVVGERTKRETEEKAKPKATKEEKIKQAREIVKAPGKLEVKDEAAPFPGEIAERKISEAEDFINESDIPD